MTISGGVSSRTDQGLHAEIALKVIRDQFPEVEAETAELLVGGLDCYTFIVDKQWVFRFPRGKGSELRLELELTVLKEIASDSPVPLPAYRFQGKPTRLFGYRFGGYPFLSGEQLMNLDLPNMSSARLAAQLGGFLGYVHNFESSSLPGHAQLGAGDSMPDVREEALDMLQHVRSRAPRAVFDRCRSFLADPNRLPSPYSGQLRLVHNDLGDEHILVDPQRHIVTGVIDWGGLVLGDPAKDFAGLWMYGGDEFVRQALEKYHEAIDAGFWDRVRYRGLWHAIAYLHHGEEIQISGYSKRGLAALIRTFGGG